MRTLGPLLVLTILLAACADRRLPEGRAVDRVVDRAEIGARWAALPGRPAGLVAGRSRIDIRVYRAGRLASLGHNHVLEVRGLDGRLRRLDDGGGFAELSFRPDRLRVDYPEARARAGEDFAAAPGGAAVEGTRENLLGDAVLDAENWPEIQILARIDRLDAPTARVDLVLGVRGVSRRYAVPVTVVGAGDAIQVDGVVRLRQRDFGIEPFAVLGGALQVRDVVEVDFHIVAQNSGGALW